MQLVREYLWKENPKLFSKTHSLSVSIKFLIWCQYVLQASKLQPSVSTRCPPIWPHTLFLNSFNAKHILCSTLWGANKWLDFKAKFLITSVFTIPSKTDFQRTFMCYSYLYTPKMKVPSIKISLQLDFYWLTGTEEESWESALYDSGIHISVVTFILVDLALIIFEIKAFIQTKK